MTEKPPKQTHINVRADMDVHAIAGVVMQHFRSKKWVPIELRGVGPGAVNQAIKGIAIATERISRENNVALVCTARIEDGVPRFNDREVSRVSLLVEVR